MQFSDLTFFQPFLPSSKLKFKKIIEKPHPQEPLNYFCNSILEVEKVSISCESIIPDHKYKKSFLSYDNNDAFSIADEIYDSDIWRNIDYKLKEKTIKCKSFGSFEDLILIKADESTVESSDEPKKFHVTKTIKEEIRKNLSKNYTSPLVLVKKRKKSLKDDYENNHTIVKNVNFVDDPTIQKSTFTKIPEKELEEVFRNKRCLKSKLSDAIKPLVTNNLNFQKYNNAK